MNAAELNTYPAISCQRGASAYYFDSINQQMNIMKQRICFPIKV